MKYPDPIPFTISKWLCAVLFAICLAFALPACSGGDEKQEQAAAETANQDVSPDDELIPGETSERKTTRRRRGRTREKTESGKKSVFRRGRGKETLPPPEEDEGAGEEKTSKSFPEPETNEESDNSAKPETPTPATEDYGKLIKRLEEEESKRAAEKAAAEKKIPEPEPETAPEPGTEEKKEPTREQGGGVHTALADGFSSRLLTGRLLVVWLLDSSISMHDDYRMMKEKIDYFYQVEG
ncbi:MAG: hypothetical protein ACYS8W_16525, partial [Planctomycetota bacterium]